MEKNSPFTERHRDYLIKRKISGLLFIASVYAFCVFFLLLKFGYINSDGDSNALVVLIGFALFILCCITMSKMSQSKRLYKKMPVPNYNTISTFSMYEVILYCIPVAVTAYFTFWYTFFLVLILGRFYHMMEVSNRPYINTDI